MNKPKVSIILPYRNASRTIHRCIQSIKSQSLYDWELIALNHFSDDGSEILFSKHSSLEPRIKCFDAKDPSFASTLNEGVFLSTGNLLARMDADDVMHSNRLEEQYKFLLKNKDYGLVSSCVRYRNDSKTKEGLGFQKYVEWANKIQSNSQISLSRFEESPIPHPSVMFRKEIFSKYGGYLHGQFPEDYEIWLRWLSLGVKMHKLSSTLLDWHDSDRRLSRVDPRYSLGSFQSLKAKYLSLWLCENGHQKKHISALGTGKIARKQVKLLLENEIRISWFYEVSRNKHGGFVDRLPILSVDKLVPSEREFLLILKGSRSTKRKINEYLSQKGFVRGKHFISLV